MRLLSCIDKILGRQSIRRYKGKQVPTEVKAKVLEAGRLAPSAAKQPWHFIVCETATAKEKLSQQRWSGFVKDASFVIIGVARADEKPGPCKEKPLMESIHMEKW